MILKLNDQENHYEEKEKIVTSRNTEIVHSLFIKNNTLKLSVFNIFSSIVIILNILRSKKDQKKINIIVYYSLLVNLYRKSIS